MDGSSEFESGEANDKLLSQTNSAEQFHTLLDKMGLTNKYPQKLSLRDAMTIHQGILETKQTTDQLSVLPYLIIQKIMMCDQKCRSCLFEVTKQKTFAGNGNDDISSDSESDDEDDTRIHPVDCMLAVLHCCDNILRQDLISKLSSCQLATPLLLPNPTDNSVTFLLWAMRSLIRGWKCHKTGEQEKRIVDYKGPIISFLRIGTSKSSKSEILNAVISDESKYFFFRRGCQGGDCERNFVDGSVEMSCYFPAGKDTDAFSTAITFLNLRGDAQCYKKQVAFLQNISFMSVVLIAESNIDAYSIKILESFSKNSGGIVLLLAEGKSKKKKAEKSVKELLHQTLLKGKYTKIKLKDEGNLDTIKTEVQRALKEKLHKDAFTKFICISDCCQFANEVGINIDENNEDSRAGQSYAKMVMEKVHSTKLDQIKGEMLPLQGPELWHQWAKLEKEHYRHVTRKKTTVEEFNAQIDMQKAEIRKQQVQKCENLSPLMDCFMKILLQTNGKTRMYFLQWLKLLLDDHSRQILPKLNKNYKQTRDKLLALKQKHMADDNEIKNLTAKLKLQNEKLVQASFGLEHLLREMCQIYESRKDSWLTTVSKPLIDQANHLPQVMAEIMHEGHTLELMDGDASHVPKLWVLAVIEKLKAVCGKYAREKNGGKIFVVSVLGIQSSGKSTLLNTMFGLCFNVSAGRCTRGAYIQLLPLSNSLREKIDCDYMLIVDTEGLRAPELQSEGVKHDNELATFVIGLADATIVNIFGETPGDLDDILQTSLHAFIRMRKIEIKPSCLFVHQNVQDVLASSKSMVGRQEFQGKLDKMIKVAAELENCEGEFSAFSHVIKFDDSKDVFYFPNLWKGDPPMAPVNIGYSENAQILKMALIKLTESKKTCRCSLETFKERVKNLWGAVLQENFVFSFKNTLEVCAYNELDSEYAKWSWSLQSKMLAWENATKWSVNNCDSKIESEIKNVADQCFKEVTEDIIPKTYTTLLKNMESFVEGSDHSATLSQWKHKTETRLKDLHDETEKQAKKYCDDLVANKLNYIEVDKLEKGHITEIQSHIRELVDQSWKEKKQYTEKEISEKFEEKWKEWMNNFKTKKTQHIRYPTDDEIERNIVKILRELLCNHDAKVIEKLTYQPLNKRSAYLTLKVNETFHLNSKKQYGLKSLDHNDIVTAENLTNEYLIKAREYLNAIIRESKPFNPSFVYELLRDLITSIDDVAKTEKKSSFTFTPEYKVDMALVYCTYALNVFKQVMRKIKVDNDPITKLNELKSTFFTNFKDEYNRVNNETKAANSLCGLLSTSIEEALQAKLETVIVDNIQKDKQRLSSKAGFKIQILDDLAKNVKKFSTLEMFEHYKTYLTDMKGCFRYWADYYISQYCESVIGHHSSSTNVITHLALKTLTEYTDKVTSTVNDLCKPDDGYNDIPSWLKKFTCKLQGVIPLQKSTIDTFVGKCNVTKFSEYVISGIEQVKVTLESKYSNKLWLIGQMSSRKKSPNWLLCERLIGCTATCPFCGEQCERTTQCPKDHSIKLHRYISLGRWLYDQTNQLVLRTCTDYVGTDESFKKSDGKLHKFRLYKQVYPNWEINPYTAEPAYWKWFVCNFYSEIKDWVGASSTTIPNGWDKINLIVAVDSLPNIIYSN